MRAAFLISIVFFFSSAFAQNQSGDMASMDMSHMAGHDQGMHDVSEGDGNMAAVIAPWRVVGFHLCFASHPVTWWGCSSSEATAPACAAKESR